MWQLLELCVGLWMYDTSFFISFSSSVLSPTLLSLHCILSVPLLFKISLWMEQGAESSLWWRKTYLKRVVDCSVKWTKGSSVKVLHLLAVWTLFCLLLLPGRTSALNAGEHSRVRWKETWLLMFALDKQANYEADGGQVEVLFSFDFRKLTLLHLSLSCCDETKQLHSRTSLLSTAAAHRSLYYFSTLSSSNGWYGEEHNHNTFSPNVNMDNVQQAGNCWDILLTVSMTNCSLYI